MKIRNVLKGASAPIALSVILAANPVLAQDAPVVVASEDDDEETPVSADGSSGEGMIFVTGSRIRRDEFSAPAPLTVINPEVAARQGLNSTANMVQGSPIAAGSDQVTAALSTNFLTNGGTGAETISLRGLGAERTLVLLNGRRAGPSGTRGGVSSFDLNVLPQSIVAQVDLLKDGASSIYGSDAVAGVVNLITKRDTDGIEIDLFGSVPFKTGGEQWSATATWGKTFDRGHILVSASYFRRNELARGDRSYLGCEENYVFTDETFTTRADLIDPRTGTFSCNGNDSNNTWGHVWTYDYTYRDNDGDGFADFGTPGGSNIPGSDGTGAATLFQYDYTNIPGLGGLAGILPANGPRTQAGQIALPDGWFAAGYDGPSQAVLNKYHPFMDTDTLIPETNLYTIYLDGAYELSDGVEFYAELIYNKRDNFVNNSGQIYQFGLGEIYDYYYETNGVDGLQAEQPLDDMGNPILDGMGVPVGPDANTGFGFDPFAAGFVGAALFSPTPFNPHVDTAVEVDYYRAVAGFRGDMPFLSGWAYDIYGQYSRSEGEYRNQTALKDAVGSANFRSGPNGFRGSGCPNGRTPISDRECIVVDWFSPRFNYGDYTPEEFAFLFAWDVGETIYTQKFVEGLFTGDLIDLWAGTVGVALGATIREDEINDVPGPIRQADNGFNFGGAGVTAGKSTTTEAFGEINIPLLEGLPVAQLIEFTGAARVTNVKAVRASDGLTDTTKGNWTYKLGLNWEVTDWLRLRGTYGTSYRAPALFEQFLADQTGGQSQRTIDPCIQWGLNLAQGNINQQFADNCAADGVPINHTGAGVSSAVVSGGGIGVLEPETSKAWTASVILTPTFNFLPNTDVSIAVEYFDIEVNGQIAQLGPRNVLSQCYGSEFGLSDPLCGQFFRMDDLLALPDGDPLKAFFSDGSTSNVGVVFDSFFNINSQQNRGVDVTTRIVHDFAGDTTLTFQGQMTWQTRDRIALFDGFFSDSNGEAGEPIFVGDFFAQLDTGPWSFFYNLDLIGGTDATEDYLRENGTLCPTFTVLGTVCAKLTTEAQLYHSVSITRDINENFRLTVGMSNITDNNPPRTSSLGGDRIRTFGKGQLYSQYDLLGRRAFVNLNVRY